MTDHVNSRVQRAQSATRHPDTQFILGRRLLVGRPLEFSEAVFEKNEKYFLGLIREGKIVVTSPDGTRIDSLPGGRLIFHKAGVKSHLEEGGGLEVPAQVKEKPAAPEPVAPEPEPEVVVDVAPAQEPTPEEPVAPEEPVDLEDQDEPQVLSSEEPTLVEADKGGRKDSSKKKKR
jgi:hypothetical protein